MTSKLLALTVTVPMFGVFCTSVQIVLFVVARAMVLPILFRVPIVCHLLRPFAAHFLKGYTPVLFFTQFPTILRALSLGITTLASWEVSETLFDNSVSEVHFAFPIKRTTLTVQTTASHCSIIYSRTSRHPYFWYFFWRHVLQAFCIPRVGEPFWGAVYWSRRR